MAPLSHVSCLVVKIHGDYLESRIRNTVAELSTYEEQMLVNPCGPLGTDRNADEDGHRIRWLTKKSDAAEHIAGATFARGMDATEAAAILRKLATLIEKNPGVLVQPVDSSEEFQDGQAHATVARLEWEAVQR